MPKSVREIRIIVDNVRSVYNVGSIFRTADGFAAGRIYLCGITPTPAHPKMAKTALGAEETVPWERCARTWRIVERLKREGFRVWALEECPGARPIGPAARSSRTAIVVGNEVRGVSAAVRARCIGALKIPMHGAKDSFNVAVATGIALYALTVDR